MLSFIIIVVRTQHETYSLHKFFSILLLLTIDKASYSRFPGHEIFGSLNSNSSLSILQSFFFKIA